MLINEWCEKNNITVEELEDNVFICDDKKYLLIEEKKINGEDLIFDKDFKLLLSDKEILISETVDYLLYEFGENYYYSSKEEVQMIPFKYVGKYISQEKDFSFLGIHGKYDLCNGSRSYSDWCKKAKFLGITSLGICETNTLAGTFSFQLTCKEFGIKPIFGETVDLKEGSNIKLYVKNENGWKNLLLINSQINVFGENKNVSINYVLEHSDGLVCVINADTYNIDEKFVDKIKDVFGEDLYFQFDPVEWGSDERDKKYLVYLKTYLEKIDIKPVLICDAYYLEKEDAHIRSILNKIGGIKFQYQSLDQYFKPIEDIINQVSSLFKEDDKRKDVIINDGLYNINEIVEKCNFEINTKKLFLPEYEMSDFEKKIYDDNEDLLYNLVFDALDEKGINDQQYIDRAEEELRVIKKGNIINYFLILWDIITWCKQNEIIVGLGRGSAAGSLVAYCLGITNLDPIKYKLLFERFINEARLLGELPDIDTDFESSRRDDVINYIEQKYGKSLFCLVGTYGNAKLKNAIKALQREKGSNFKKDNYITSIIGDGDIDEQNIIELFELASQLSKEDKNDLKEYLNENFDTINNLPLILNQPITQSIHACATIILPKSINSIYEAIPVKIMDGKIVSEWEGKQLEKAGFLKEDILGLTQLDKFSDIIKLIKINKNIDIKLEDIPLDDKDVFDYFGKGYTEDVFQFGLGLKGYSIELKPDTVEDLIASNALYRPGAMESNAHIDYIKIKHGFLEPKYDMFLRDVTEDTFGLYIYQEQVMKAFQIITESSLSEADSFRKIITKTKAGKITDDVKKYQDLFISSYIKKGNTQENSEEVWNKLVAFAGYGFNRSHAACYGVTAYHCQWFKYHYPLEFWTVSLKHSKKEKIVDRLSEINKTKNVKIYSPDINKSGVDFITDTKTNGIYWSLLDINQLGDVAVSKIINERDKNGEFFSFDEFLSRVKLSKTIVTNLILSGAFDEIEDIDSPKQRKKLINRFYEKQKLQLDEIYKSTVSNYDHFWEKMCRDVCKFSFINYYDIFNLSTFTNYKQFITSDDLILDSNLDEECVAIGLVQTFSEGKTKNGPYCKIVIDNNYDTIKITVWPETYSRYKDELKNCVGKIICLNGLIKKGWKSEKNEVKTFNESEIQIF